MILENWGLFNAANAPHMEMFAVNWAWYQEERQRAYEFEREAERLWLEFESSTDKKKKAPKLGRNLHLGRMHTFEKKAQMNLAAMGVGTMGLAKVGQAMARATKKEGIEALMD